MYPPSGYPQQPGYPPQQPGYNPSAPPMSGYPPQQPGYPPQPSYAPGQGYAPQQPGYPPAPSGYAPPHQPGQGYAPQQPGYPPHGGPGYSPVPAGPPGAVDPSRFSMESHGRFAPASITYHDTQSDTYSVRFDTGAELHQLQYWKIYIPSLVPPSPAFLVDGARILAKTKRGDFVKGTVRVKAKKDKKEKKDKKHKKDKHKTPGYGAPAPSYGAPGYGAPGYGAPGYGAPGYGSPAAPMGSAGTTGKTKITIRTDRGRKLKVKNPMTDTVLIPNRRPTVGERVLVELDRIAYGHHHHGHRFSDSDSD